jgi:hypothetical protein
MSDDTVFVRKSGRVLTCELCCERPAEAESLAGRADAPVLDGFLRERAADPLGP